MYLLNAGSSEGRITPAVSFAIRQLTAFSVIPGMSGAILPRVARPNRSNPPSDAGTPAAVSSCSRRADLLAVRIRNTWSVRSSRRSRPAESASSLDRRVAEAASLREVSARDASKRASARAWARSISSASLGNSLTGFIPLFKRVAMARVLCQSMHVDVELIQNQSALLFRQLVGGVPQVMGSIKDLNDRHVYANEGFCARLGLKASDVQGRTVRELFGDELADSYLGQDELVLKTGRPLQNHLELIVRADGQLGWYVTSKSVLRAGSGEAIGIAVLSVDLHSQVNSAHAGLARVIAAIRDRIHRQWRVAEMAEIAGLSSPSLERLARRTLGLPPQQLLQRLRLEHAVFLITQTSQSMGDVAAECGFYDQSSFTRQFRKVLGLTPGAYRRVG